MPELRKDPALGRWVIVATERVRRPADFARRRPPARHGPCALCPGHEHETPPALLALPADEDEAAGWRVRVVPNRFPTLRVEGGLERRGEDMYDLMNGIGAHELVVASPEHDQTLGRMAPAALEDVLRACRDRVLDLRRDERLRAAVLFQRYGVDAGVAPEHPHLELLAAPVVPFDLTVQLDRARAYHDYRERCLFCDMLRHEVEARVRVVAETPEVVAFAPFAAARPFEMRLVPRRHGAAFEYADVAELRDLARALRTVLGKLERALADPAYALRLHTAPFGGSESPSFHWHVEIVPALDDAASGSGLHVNPVPPEDAARFLREAGE